MSIENFLNDFNKQDDRLRADREKNELDQKLRVEGQEKFIKSYKSYFEEELKKKLESVADKLQKKFTYEILEPKDFQGNNCLTELILKSNFDHHIKRVKFQITTEGDRKLISFGADAEATHGKKIGDHYHNFQGSLNDFESLNLEEEISKILNKIYIRR